MDIPLTVRRRAWELNMTLFEQAVEEPCRQCLAQLTDGNPRRPDGPVSIQYCISICNFPTSPLVASMGSTDF